MAVQQVWVDGIEYPMAPLEPEKWDHPTPANLVAITPEVARRWLGYNYRNRTLREGGKRDYSADMRQRNFTINGSTITFTRPHRAGEDELVPEGSVSLLDGQHRLESCVSSGTPFVTYVAYGLAPEVRLTVDTGIKRKLPDVLKLSGEHSTYVLASVITRCHSWETGNYHLNAKRGGKTHTALINFLEEHPEVRRSVQVAMQTRAAFSETTSYSLRQSVLGLAHWLFMQVDETAAPEFFVRLGDGAKMETHDPLMFLRRRFVRDLSVKRQEDGDSRRQLPTVEDWQYLCYIIRTWNARLLYSNLPEEQKPLYNYALLGPSDSKRMPAIKTPDQAFADAVKYLEKDDSKSPRSSSPTDD